MKPIILMRPDTRLSDGQMRYLKETIEGIGYKGIIAEHMAEVQIHQPVISFRETAALAFMRDLNISTKIISDGNAMAAVNAADLLITELAKAKE